MKKTSLVPTLAAALGATAIVTTTASAHIDTIGPLEDRGGDQKTPACGGARRSSSPYTFEPGSTITVGVHEGIPHDSYFRISFDNDGDNGFQDPKSIDPINPNRYGTGKKCQGTAEDNCGKSDFCNVVSTDGPTVLWDNLDPHLGAGFEDYTWTVKLPDIECETCTIQIQQIMEDPLGSAHGPFDGENDIYYRCIDIVLKKGATASAGVSTEKPSNKGIDCLASAGSGTPAEPSAPTGGGKSDAGALAGNDAGPASARDAGSDGGSNSGSKPTEEGNDNEDDDAPATGTKVDAGKPTTTKVDASTAKKDAGAGDHADHDDDTEDSDEDEDDDDTKGSEQPTSTDDGCSISSGSASTQGWSFALTALLTTALVTIRRRRSR